MPTNRISLWDGTAQEDAVGGAFPDGGHFDVVAVGGGFTGLSTALHGAEKGLSVHVLEAHQIGHGGSGRNVGLVNAGVWLPPQDVPGIIGKEKGAGLIDTLGKMPGYVFSLIEKHQIRCEARQTGSIHAAHSPKGFENLRRRAEGWKAVGAPVDLLSAGEVAEQLGTRVYHGGLLDRRAGTINPMGYVRGLARAALGAGASISTGVRVTGLERDGERWRVLTDKGEVTAKSVVLGTNAYTDELWPGLKNTFTTVEYFQVATKPLTGRLKGIYEEVRGSWDTAQVMISLRRDAHDRLIIGSMGAVIGGETGLSRRWAAKNLARFFPDLGPVEFEEAWHGQIAMTPDHIFRVHRLAEGLYTPIAYNGRGITTGTMFGRALADILTGADLSTLPVAVTDVKPVSNRALKIGFYRAAFAAAQVWRSI
jgi:glycine/D-amino acid oxidase-like deaminating enzyme